MIRASKSSQFEEDCERAILYLANANPAAALRFIDAIDVAVQLLSQFPEIGPIWRHDDRPTRFFVLPQFRNYLIFYRIESDELKLGRLLHGAQNLRDILEE